MPQAAETRTAPDTIEATVNYLLDTGEVPFTYTGGPGSTVVQSNIQPDPRSVTMRNGRHERGRLDLERNGFRFVDHPTRVKDFFDAEEVLRVYYPEIETLIRNECGAHRVVVFDHTLRTSDDDDREKRKIREAVTRVHNDYTEWSGPQRLREILPDEADELLKRRFAIIQVWRPIRHPVERMPLALCDAQSLAPQDLVISERRYSNRVGQTYAITYNPQHRWYWFPLMQRDEALVFKVYDSEKEGHARWTPHTSFNDPTSRPGSRPRESIEIRTLALF